MLMIIPEDFPFDNLCGIYIDEGAKTVDVPDRFVGKFKKYGFKEHEPAKPSDFYKCKYCGEFFPNKGFLMAHHRSCEKNPKVGKK